MLSFKGENKFPKLNKVSTIPRLRHDVTNFPTKSEFPKSMSKGSFVFSVNLALII